MKSPYKLFSTQRDDNLSDSPACSGAGNVATNKQLLTHEIAIKILYTQRHDNLSDSPAKAGQAMWPLKTIINT
jgi:hypothetical protein